MSRFGMQHNVNRGKPITPSKKPFVSTTKRVETFGTPPPLPPLPFSEKIDTQTDTEKKENIVESKGTEVVNLSLLYKQSIRWLNTSSTLWSLIVADSARNVDRNGLKNFLTAMQWRIQGTINEDEFTALYNEWLGVKSIAQKYSHPCGKIVLRSLLMEQSLTEEDLDLLLGMIINEINRKTVNSPLKFEYKSNNNTDSRNKPLLEVCSYRWISLSEELFFLLDNKGYGQLNFDHLYVLSICLILGVNSYKSDEEVDYMLSITQVTMLALQLMTECGINVKFISNAITSNKVKQKRKSMTFEQGEEPLQVHYDHHGRRVSTTPFTNNFLSSTMGMDQNNITKNINKTDEHFTISDICSFSQYHVTISMFKVFLQNKGLGESSLLSLISHVRDCTEQMQLLFYKKVPDLYNSCVIYQGVAGPPQLWTYCVCRMSGYENIFIDKGNSSKQSDDYHHNEHDGDSDSGRSDHITNSTPPPIILFLLSDAEKYICPSWFANDDFIDTNNQSINESPVETVKDITRVNEQLVHESCFRIWCAFFSWSIADGKNSSNNFNIASDSNGGHLSNLLYIQKMLNMKSTPVSSSPEIYHHPLYQLILSILSEYKGLQYLMNAAAVDLAIDYFLAGKCNNLVGVHSGIGVACKSLMSPDGASRLLSDYKLTRTLLQPVASITIDDEVQMEYKGRDSSVLPTSHLSTIGNDDTREVEKIQEDNYKLSSVFDTIRECDSSTKIECIDDKATPKDIGRAATHTHRTDNSFFKETSLVDISVNRDENSSSKSFKKWLISQDFWVKDNNNFAEQSQNAKWIVIYDNKSRYRPINAPFDVTLNIDNSEPNKAARTGKHGVETFRDSSNLLQLQSRPESASSKSSGSSANGVVDLSSRKSHRRKNMKINNEIHSDTEESYLFSADSQLLNATPARKGSDIKTPKSVSIPEQEQLRSLNVNNSRALNEQSINIQNELIQKLLNASDDEKDSIISELRALNIRGTQNAEHERHASKSEFESYPHNFSSHEMIPNVNHNLELPHESGLPEETSNILSGNISQKNGVLVSNTSPTPPLRVNKRRSNASQVSNNYNDYRGEGESLNISPDSHLSRPSSSTSSASTSLASSVAELLEQGASAGMYAHTLREILRKMSRDDANMQLKSLEQILALGNNIVLGESAALKKTMNGQANIPEIVRKPYVISPLATKSKSEQRWNPATNDTPLTPSSSRSHYTPSKLKPNDLLSTPEAITLGDDEYRLQHDNIFAESIPKHIRHAKKKIPGMIPATAKERKQNQKVFGQPL